MISRMTMALSALVLALGTVGSAQAGGIPIGIKPMPGGELPPTFNFFDFNPSINVGQQGEPVPFILDPTMPDAYWTKNFVLQLSDGLSNDATIPVREFLAFGSNPDTDPQPVLTDWHEEILDASFVWGSGRLLILDDFGEEELLEVQGEISDDGKSIWFEWDFALSPETQITIEKDLIYIGPDQTELFLTVPVREYATTPEPASVALMALGGLAMIRRRRR